jgi:hypothetical protein
MREEGEKGGRKDVYVCVRDRGREGRERERERGGAMLVAG